MIFSSFRNLAPVPCLIWIDLHIQLIVEYCLINLDWNLCIRLVGGFLFGKVFDIRLCMFPSCSHCFTGLRTYFVFSVAQLLPMLVNFFGFNGNFNGKMTKIKKMAKNHFSEVQNGSQSVSMGLLGGYLYWKVVLEFWFRHPKCHFRYPQNSRKHPFWAFLGAPKMALGVPESKF